MITSLFLSFLEVTLSTSLIIALLLLSAPLLDRRYAAKWKYWIWIFLALRLVIPFSVSDIVNDIRARSVADRHLAEISSVLHDTMGTDLEAERPTVPRRPVTFEIPEQAVTPIALPEQQNAGGIAGGITILDVAAWIWFGGCMLFIAVHVTVFIHYRRRLAREGMPAGDEHVLALLSSLAGEMRLGRHVPVMVYDRAASPMVIGFFRPVLVLPDEQYSEQELFFIVKHELVHIKRRDVWVKLLLTAANAVHWLNPLMWLMQREAAVDMELSCDESVIRHMDYEERKLYTETLFSTFHRRCARTVFLSTQFCRGKQVMKRRFRNILGSAGKKSGVAVLAGVVLVAAAMGMLVGCSVAGTDRGGVPDIVRQKAERFVEERYMACWQSADGYSDWRIESLTHCHTYEDFEGMTVQVYRLNYQYLSERPEEVALVSSGMSIDEDGWVVVTYPDSHFFFYQQEGDALTYLGYMFDRDCQPGDETFTREFRRIYKAGALNDDEQRMNAHTYHFGFSQDGHEVNATAQRVFQEGYSIYLSDGDWSWEQTGTDEWTAVADDRIRLRVEHFEDKTTRQLEQELVADGYVFEQRPYSMYQALGAVRVDKELVKRENDMVYKVHLNNAAWKVSCCFPAAEEEVWGYLICTLVNTFAVIR